MSNQLNIHEPEEITTSELLREGWGLLWPMLFCAVGGAVIGFYWGLLYVRTGQ